jgi:hypothetical protein
MKTIEVTFDDAGNAKIETTGFRGGECLQATIKLEEALGKKTGDKKKPEALLQPGVQQCGWQKATA